jgi:ketosteroid isomerase-like protein
MALTDVASGLVKLCRKGKFLQAVDKYYSDDIVSVEPVASPQMPAEQSGIDKIRGKNQWFEDTFEVHSVQVDGPFLGKGQFAARFTLDVTQKAGGKRFTMNEMALYTVKKGKVVREEFYYNAMQQ